jgi:hypothetical protein
LVSGAASSRIAVQTAGKVKKVACAPVLAKGGAPRVRGTFIPAEGVRGHVPIFHSHLDKTRTMVRDAIRGLGADPDQAELGPDTWLLRKRSAAVVLRLIPEDAKGRAAFLQLTSPVMRLPPNAAIHERLARFNFEMGGLATFCVTPADEVHLTCARTIEGIDPKEIAQLLAQVAHYSDLYDDALLKEFGREHALHAGQKP